MANTTPTTVLSHWNQMIPELQYSSTEFYGALEGIIRGRNLDHTKWERVNLSEGGMFSAKREYLQLRRREHVFHICAAPFGNGFFVSWWLGRIESGLWAWVASWPIIGALAERFLKPLTYYKIDTGLMFQSITHGAVLEVLDEISEVKGIRRLSDLDRKPIMRDFFAQIAA